MQTSEKLITLQVNNDEGEVLFEKKIPSKDLYDCMLIRNIVDDLCGADMKSNEELVIPIPSSNATSPDHFDSIVEYAQFMRTADYPRDQRKEDSRIFGELTEWEKKFAAKLLQEGNLEHVILLSNYLEFKPMLEGLCFASALQEITAKPPKPIKIIKKAKTATPATSDNSASAEAVTAK